MLKKTIATTVKSKQALAAIQQQQNYSLLVADYVSTPSKSEKECKERVLSLYRHVARWLPYVKDRFHVPIDLALMRKRIRLDFEKYKNAGVTRGLTDAMVFRGYNELEEVKRQHQTRPHVLKVCNNIN